MEELEERLISGGESKVVVTHDKEAEGGLIFSASMNLKNNLYGGLNEQNSQKSNEV